MVERAGCVTGARGRGKRKFNGVVYNIYKIYVARQTDYIDQEKQEKLNIENKALMEQDRQRLKNEGYKTKVLRENAGQTEILYYIKVENNS